MAGRANHAWIIRKAATGAYDPGCLDFAPREPVAPGPGEVTVRTLLLSLDPTSRNWLKLDPRYQYLPLAVGDVMLGAGVGVVQVSRAEGFAPGDLVSGMWGWATASTTPAILLSRIAPDPNVPLEAHLTVFSHIGRAAAGGLLIVGEMKPGDTVVVSGAAGATGSLAVQIAKANGCRVVGVAGGEAKRRLLLDEFGLDAAIDYRAADLDEALARACPDGVDLFFDNVGGAVLDAVLGRLAIGARIAVCGAMSQYDLARPQDAYGVRNLPMIMFRQARMQGFVVPQFADRYGELDAELRRLFLAGKLRHRAHLIEGLERAAEALGLLLSGGNDGKLMVRVAEAA